MRRLLALIPFVILATAGFTSCPSPQPPPTCTRYVSSNISQADAAASSGDVLCVRGGTYRELVSLSRSGVTVQAAPGEAPVIDGSTFSIAPHDQLVLIEGGVNNSTLEGFTIQNSSGRGLMVGGAHNTIRNNLVRHIGYAAIITTNWWTAADANTFDSNELTDSVKSNTPCSTDGGWESAVNHYGGGSGRSGNNVWTNNNIHDNWGEGMVLANGEIVENNTVRDNYSVDVYMDAAVGTTVRNNTISESETSQPSCYRLRAIGVGFADENSPHRLSNNSVTGNTIRNTSQGVNFWNAGVAGSGIINTTIDNNTIDQTWNCGICLDAGAHSNSTVRGNHITVRSGSTTSGVQNTPGITYVAG